MTTLYQSAREVLEPIVVACPISISMDPLMPKSSRAGGGLRVAADTMIDLGKEKPLLVAAGLLYLDALHEAHEIVQDMESLEAAYLHGILHRREADFWNANYWFRKSGHLPKVLLTDPVSLTNDYQLRGGHNPSDLVERSRDEWVRIVNYIAERS